VSSEERVVRSMQAMERRSHAACQSFFTLRRVPMVEARRSTAEVFTRISSTQSRLSGMRTLGVSSRPCRVTGSDGEDAWAASVWVAVLAAMVGVFLQAFSQVNRPVSKGDGPKRCERKVYTFWGFVAWW